MLGKQIETRIKLGLITVLAVFALSLILAQKATPNSGPFFALKRTQERIFLSLKNNPPDRIDYMSRLLDNRLDELNRDVKSQRYGYILPAASRYSTLAGQITDLIVANKLTDKVNPVKIQFLNHKKILREIYVIYPKNTENVEYKYIEDDINYLDLYLDKLSKVKF